MSAPLTPSATEVALAKSLATLMRSAILDGIGGLDPIPGIPMPDGTYTEADADNSNVSMRRLAYALQRMVQPMIGAVASGPWIRPTLLNGWTDYDPNAYFPIAYRTVWDGATGGVGLQFRGIGKNTVPANRNLDIFQLPAELRPNHIVVLPLRVNLSPVSFGTMLVRTDGTVALDGYTVANPEGAIGLDGQGSFSLT